MSKRADIKVLEDIPGKKVAVVTDDSLAGYQMQAYELAVRGMPLPRNLVKTGMPHDRAVEAVLNGQADVGFARSGVLEAMAREGKLNMAQLRILNRQEMPGLPWALFTRLYPEWPFAALPHTDDHLARNVAAVLFTLDQDKALMHRMKISGFTIPADYAAVTELLRELRLPPFDDIPRFTVADVLKKYLWESVVATVLLGLVALLAIRLMLTNRNLHTAQQMLAGSEQHYRLLMEHMRDVVWILDPESLHFLYVSPSVERLRGYTAEEVMREPVDAALTPEFAAGLKQIIRERLAAFESGVGVDEVYATEVQQPCKDGSMVWTEAITRYYRNKTTGKIEIHGVTRDISERKKAEEALQRSNADLERFAYSVSHDMRQPLRAISGHLQLLQRSLKDKLDEQERENMHFALDGAKRMDSMIVSLLDYSRVGRKTEAKKSMASRESLDEALGFLEPAIRQAKAEISVAGAWPQVYASRDELTRLFQNLIGNALLYREPDRSARVEVESVVGETWRVSVRDHGIGIESQQINRLFQFFSRLQSRTRFEGSGMGLALCRRIVEHHGGRIWAESEGAGKGSTFTFEMPLSQPIEPAPSEALGLDGAI